MKYVRWLLIYLSITAFSSLSAFSHVDRFELKDFGVMKNTPLLDIEGKRKTIKSYRGKYVLLTFWATWCRACLSEMPALEKLAEQFKHDDLVVAVISREYGAQKGLSVKTVRLKGKLFHLEFLTDIDGGALHKEYKINGLPTAILIDRSGRVIGRLEGAAPWNDRDFIRFFQDVLDDKIRPTENKPSFWERIFGKKGS